MKTTDQIESMEPQGKPQHSLIAVPKIDKWLNELREILVQRSEFKLADNVVSARVVIKMLEKNLTASVNNAERLAEACAGLLAELTHGQNVPSLAILEMMREALAAWESQK